MKTKDIPAIVMLLAGVVYCIIGIRDKVVLWDFSVQLLIVLIVFYILGGILKMVLDRFIGEIKDKKSEDEVEENATEESKEETAEDDSEEEEDEEEEDAE